jgi:hypothetical protein
MAIAVDANICAGDEGRFEIVIDCSPKNVFFISKIVRMPILLMASLYRTLFLLSFFEAA